MKVPVQFQTIWVLRNIYSGVNGSVTLGDGLTQRGKHPRGRKSPIGVQGRRSTRGSSRAKPPSWYLFWKWM